MKYCQQVMVIDIIDSIEYIQFSFETRDGEKIHYIPFKTHTERERERRRIKIHFQSISIKTTTKYDNINKPTRRKIFMHWFSSWNTQKMLGWNFLYTSITMKGPKFSGDFQIFIQIFFSSFLKCWI